MERKNETKETLNPEELEDLVERLNKINFENDKEVVDFISNLNFTDCLTGTTEDGEDVIFNIEAYKSISVSVFQNNGFIKKNIYTIDGIDLIREEIYEPSGN